MELLHAGADGQDADSSVAVEIFTLAEDGNVLLWRGLPDLAQLHSLLRSNMVRCFTFNVQALDMRPFLISYFAAAVH
jgi:hypothetical protein